MLAPLLATLFSAALLGERLDARCHVAIATGLGGTLLLIRPTGAHFDAAMLLPFGAAVSYALSLNLSRALSKTESTAAIVVYDYAVVLTASGLLLPAYWITPELVDWPVFAIMGICGGLSLYYRVRACRHAPVKTLAPLDYTGIAWAILLGYVLWQESPDLWGYVGIALIGGSAIFVLRQKPEQAGAAGP
jgi:drug/metabolite transporter (DMT)-like permease